MFMSVAAGQAAFAVVPGSAGGAPALAGLWHPLAAPSGLDLRFHGNWHLSRLAPLRASAMPSGHEQPTGPDGACKWGLQPGARRPRSARSDGLLSVGLKSSSSNQFETADEGEDMPLQTVVMPKEETGVVLAPDFRLALSVLMVGIQLWWALNWPTLGIFISVVGGFLTMQTARLRFRFTSSAIDVLRVRGLSDTGSESGKTVDVEADVGGAGGAMRETSRAVGPWKFSKIVNWDFWWPGFPVLAYFKETQVLSSAI